MLSHSVLLYLTNPELATSNLQNLVYATPPHHRPATGANADEPEEEPVEKAKPNFEKSGKLLEETNTFKVRAYGRLSIDACVRVCVCECVMFALP